MDDRLRETLSAMMDDEADELAVRRLLASPERDEVSTQWQRWQRLRDLMHDDASGAGAAVDVSRAVRRQLSGGSPADSVSGAVERQAPLRPRWRWSATALVALSVLIGFGMGAGWDAAHVEQATRAATATTQGDASRPDVPQVALQGLDHQQWETLSRYLLEHAQHNSVGAGRGAVGYARLASVSGHGQ